MQPRNQSLVSVDGLGADTPQVEEKLTGCSSLMSTLVSVKHFNILSFSEHYILVRGYQLLPNVA
ncbi:hypothetical protein XENOCAPTIV_025865, partial [Xenoophorus captivus]